MDKFGDEWDEEKKDDAEQEKNDNDEPDNVCITFIHFILALKYKKKTAT